MSNALNVQTFSPSVQSARRSGGRPPRLAQVGHYYFDVSEWLTKGVIPLPRHSTKRLVSHIARTRMFVSMCCIAGSFWRGPLPRTLVSHSGPCNSQPTISIPIQIPTTSMDSSSQLGFTFRPATFYKHWKLESRRSASLCSLSLFIFPASSVRPNKASFIIPIPTRSTLVWKAHAEDENTSLFRDEDGEGIGDFEKKQGTVAGAVALIIGTSIGSGILALPMRAAPAGIVPSSVCMVTCWAFLLIEAFLLVEVNVSLRKKRKRSKEKEGAEDELGVISIRTMARDTLGEWGGTVATAAYVFLGYTTMVAYCSKSGEILCDLINVPASFSGLFFTAVFGLLISAGGTLATDQVNKLLTAAMIGLLVAIEVVVVAYGGWSGVAGSGDWAKVPATIPVMIFSLVYHDVAPVICAYLDGDLRRIRNSVLIGSLVPLLALLVWDAIALGLSSDAEPLSDPVHLLMREGWSGVSTMVTAFSLLAVATSLIGTLLGFSEFFKEQLVNLNRPSPKAGASSEAFSSRNQWERKKTSFLSVALVVGPSLLVSTTVQDAFAAATDIAGGYCMTMLYGVLPPAMAWTMRHSADTNVDDTDGGSNEGGMLGSRPELLVGSGLFAIALVLEQFVQDFILFHK